MSSGPAHYLAAAALLERASKKESMEVIDSLTREAAVHAALAQAAAQIDTANEDTVKWKEILK